MGRANGASQIEGRRQGGDGRIGERVVGRILVISACLSVLTLGGGCDSRSGGAASTGSAASTQGEGSELAQSSAGATGKAQSRSGGQPAHFTPEEAAEIDTFCSACHLNPRAEYFPKHAWHDEVDRAFGFWVDSGRTDLPVPAMHRVVSYYRDRAPDKLRFPLPESSETPFSAAFEPRGIDPAKGVNPPGVVHLQWARLRPDQPPVFITCDMRLGEVRAVDPRKEPAASQVLAQLKHPCRSTLVDFDRDGTLELLVADLGSIEARDHRDGRVIWLRQGPPGEAWQVIEVATGLGRVADVRAADFDGDGDLDVAVAEFGWHKTGSVLWLETKQLGASPQFESHTVDPRPGAIHLPIVDLNADGRPDFLALMSQDYEEVLAWINQGDGTFERQVVGERQDPSFGSSGIEPVDLDGDGDLDWLYTNGDTFDSHLAKPYHGLQWLENTGSLPYRLHRLADMIGSYRAVPADLDGDGDLDIVLAGFLPSDLVDRPPLDQHDSLVVLEQTALGKFARHRLESGQFHHAAVEVADFDEDGDLDVALGGFIREAKESQPRVQIWWNQGARNAKGAPSAKAAR